MARLVPNTCAISELSRRSLPSLISLPLMRNHAYILPRRTVCLHPTAGSFHESHPQLPIASSGHDQGIRTHDQVRSRLPDQLRAPWCIARILGDALQAAATVVGTIDPEICVWGGRKWAEVCVCLRMCTQARTHTR